MTLVPGQTLNNRYRIVALLGQGGFGAVYRAWDTNLKRPCAVKENLDTSAEAARQFAREARVLANLNHPNLPRVTDHFMIKDQGQYLVMDFIEGQDLEAMRINCPEGLPEDQAVNWIGQVCEALSYLHNQNPPIIHRDIKPANIKITPEGRAVLVDFGIAKVYDPHLKTTIGARAVTPGYSPTEQYGSGRTDARSDVYALGATLYALLTCREPIESIQRNLGIELAPLRSIMPSISISVENAIHQAMALLPSDRFSGAAEFKDALFKRPSADPTLQISGSRSAQAGMQAPPLSLPQPATKPGWLIWMILGAVAVLAVAVLLFIVSQFSDNSTANTRRTETALALALTQNAMQTTPGEMAKTPDQIETDPPATGAPTHTPAPEISSTPADTIPPAETPIPSETPRPPTDTLAPSDTPVAPTAVPAIAPLTGSGTVQMTFDNTPYYMAGLSPDQRGMVAFAKIDDHWQLVEVDPNNGGMVRQITSAQADHYHPHFSGDGQNILLASNRQGSFDIYLISFQSGEVVSQLTQGGASDMTPYWMPDGRSFVFMSNRDGDFEIYLGYLDGSTPKQLTDNDSYDGSCSVSPDGRHIVFYSDRDGDADIYLMEISSGLTRQLTNDSSRDAEPVFSPDGQWVAFESKRSGDYDIYIVRLNGSDLRRAVGGPANQQIPGFSPDGKWLLYQSDENGSYDLYRIPWP